MLKNIRTPSLAIATAIATVLACTPAAIAFPPCPLDDTKLIPLDGAAASGTSSWSSAIYSHAGSMAPVRIKAPCQQNFPEVLGRVMNTGQCDEDVLMLDELPRRASPDAPDQPIGYSKRGWVGYLGMPELRLAESLDKRYEYTFTIAVNTTALAHPGDWIDIAEITLIGRDDTAPPTTYRLRKIHAANGATEIRLISSHRLHEPGAPARSVIAVIPLDKKTDFQNIGIRWSTISRTRNPPPLATKPVALPPSEFVVDTQLTVTAGASVIHQGVLEDLMPNDVSMGILDYNLPKASDEASTVGEGGAMLDTGSSGMQRGSETTSSTPPPIPGMDEPGRALIFPRATLSARRI